MPVRMVVGVAAVMVLVAALAAAPAGATGSHGKELQVIVESPEWAGVTDASYAVKLTNKSHNQRLGAVDLTVPPALTITNRNGIGGSGNVLSLRNLGLQPSASKTITVGLRMPCAAGSYPWTVKAKQANEFHGSGNDFDPITGTLATKVEGACKLRFAEQPASAEKNTQIRADAFQPASTRFVSVEALDGSPAPQRLTWFTGSIALASNPAALPPTSAQAAAGLATFTNLSIATAGNYTLRATTTTAGIAPTDSAPFQVIDVVEPCSGAHCTAQLAAAQTKATYTGSPSGGSGFALLSLNLGRDPLTGAGCAGYKPPSLGEYYEFQLAGVAAPTTFTVEYGKAAMKWFKGGAWALQACLGVPGPDTFVTKSGSPAPPFDYDGDPGNGAEGFAGLLPNCPKKPAKPCVLCRDDTYGGGAKITIFVPADLGDPRMH